MATNPNDAVGTNAAYSGRTSPKAFNDVLALFKGRGILTGWQCLPSNNMVVTLGGQSNVRDVAIAEDNAGNKTTIDNISEEPIEVEIAAASNTSASTDYLVAYVNNPPEGTPLAGDNPGACGLIDVRGSGAAAPTEAQIRAAITADGGTGVTAYYVILATISVPAGTTTITASNITQGDGTMLPPTKELSLYALNLAVTNDTPIGWGNALGNKNGHYWIRYDIANQFPSQLYQWGILEIWQYGTDTYQRWYSMPDGSTYERRGNAAGWNNLASVSGSQAWTEVNTNSNTGLAGYAIQTGKTDLNNYPAKSGFYMGEDGANRPPAVKVSSDWWYVEQIVHNNYYRTQIARSFFNSSVVYQRVMDGGTWKPWTLASGNVYSTNEQAIGTWIDGKTIYRKVVSFGSLPNNTSKEVNTGIANIAQLIKFSNTWYDSEDKAWWNDQTYFNIINNDRYMIKMTLKTNASPAVLKIEAAGTNWEARTSKGYAVIEYTKN